MLVQPLTFLISALAANPPSALPQPFDTLAKTEVGAYSIYAPSPLKPLSVCDGGVLCFEASLEYKGPPYCVVFDPGPSEDPTFLVFRRESCRKSPEESEALLSVGATALIIPGNGFLYTSGHTDNYFDIRRKFEVKGRSIREVVQPFYFVGGKRRVQRPATLDAKKPVEPVVLRSEKKDTAAVVATLPEGSECEVLLSDGPLSGWFLVRTAFGLVGWYHAKSQTLEPDPLGIFFNGD